MKLDKIKHKRSLLYIHNDKAQAAAYRNLNALKPTQTHLILNQMLHVWIIYLH